MRRGDVYVHLMKRTRGGGILPRGEGKVRGHEKVYDQFKCFWMLNEPDIKKSTVYEQFRDSTKQN